MGIYVIGIFASELIIQIIERVNGRRENRK